ncbi:unnamed protein product, partial [Candidula unifasciata]
KMSLVLPEKCQHILRVMNTNIDDRIKVSFATISFRGVGHGFATVVFKKANVDIRKRAGELSEEAVKLFVTAMANHRQHKITDWFLKRPKDIKGGRFTQVLSNGLDNKLREDLECLKKICAHRHTKTTDRRGRTVSVAKKK